MMLLMHYYACARVISGQMARPLMMMQRAFLYCPARADGREMAMRQNSTTPLNAVRGGFVEPAFIGRK